MRREFENLCSKIAKAFYMSRFIQMSERVADGYRFRIAQTTLDFAESFAGKLNAYSRNKRFRVKTLKAENHMVMCEEFTNEFQVQVHPFIEMISGQKEANGIYKLELDAHMPVEMLIEGYFNAAFMSDPLVFPKLKVYCNSIVGSILIYRDVTNYRDFWRTADWKMNCQLFMEAASEISAEIAARARKRA